jgi:hypothetical protein
METKHTPGPWSLKRENGRFAIIPDCRSPIALAYTAFNGLPQEKDEANARLIAAAPDLLAALEAVLAANPLPAGMTERRGVMAQAEDSVKKAREG